METTCIYAMDGVAYMAKSTGISWWVYNNNIRPTNDTAFGWWRQSFAPPRRRVWTVLPWTMTTAATKRNLVEQTNRGEIQRHRGGGKTVLAVNFPEWTSLEQTNVSEVREAPRRGGLSKLIGRGRQQRPLQTMNTFKRHSSLDKMNKQLNIQTRVRLY